MTGPRWRLVGDGARTGASNMALDAGLLDGVASGTAPPTVRFYGWSPPCLSLGRHQPAGAVDLRFCRREGIDVVRRPTGGRAVLHHLEVTYAVVAPVDGTVLPAAVQGAYRRIAGALVDGLRVLGVEAELAGESGNGPLPRPTEAIPCFRIPAGGEIVVRGRKLVGSAVRIRGGAVLQHGSILLDWDGRLQAGALGLADDSALRPHVTTVAAELGDVPESGTIVRLLAGALERELGVELVLGPLTGAELRTAERRKAEFRVAMEAVAG